jgi:protocatechuate 3,4-dioxygenase beta subunit
MKQKIFTAVLLAAAVMFAGAQAQMPDMGTISGTVTVQDSGNAINHAMVMAYAVDGPAWPAGMASTDETGAYQLRVPYGQYYVKAHKFEYLPEWWEEAQQREDATAVTVDEDNNPDNINFTLVLLSSTYGSISGTVTDFDTDDPIEDATVKLRLPNSPFHFRTVHTAADGSYMFDDLLPGTYTLECYKDGYLPAQYPDPVVVNGDDITDIDFALEPLVFGSISGTVTNTDDELLEGARIIAHLPEQHHFYREAFSGEDGTYMIDELPPGDYRLVCMAEGYIHQEYPDSVPVNGDDVTGIDFVLEPLVFGGISGVITDVSTSEPIAGAFVYAIGENMPHHHCWARTNEDGEYIFEHLLAGTYHVEAHAIGYNPGEYEDPVVVVDTVVPDIDIALDAIDFGSISGTVYNTDNEVLPGASIMAHKTDSFWSARARSDSAGDYTLTNLIPGTYRIKAYAWGYRPDVYDDAVVVDDGQNVTDIDFYLEPYGTPYDGYISGNVIDDSTSDPIDNALLIAFGRFSNHRGFMRFAHTDEDGNYTFNRMPDASFKIFCLAWGYQGEFYDDKPSWQEADPVTPDADNIDFGLSPVNNGPRVLSGRVIENGLPVLGAIVTARQGDEIVALTATYPDGYYYLENLDPGDYDIEVLGPELNEGYLENVSVLFSDNFDADIVLSPTAIDEEDAILPSATTLLQNYPNPFNATTNISFYLNEAGNVDLSIYDVLGRKVVTLESAWLDAGNHTVTWNSMDSNNNSVVSGMYFYILKTDKETLSHRMVLLK